MKNPLISSVGIFWPARENSTSTVKLCGKFSSVTFRETCMMSTAVVFELHTSPSTAVMFELHAHLPRPSAASKQNWMTTVLFVSKSFWMES